MAITIRGCNDADVPGVVALIEDRIGEEDAPEARLVLGDATYDRSRWSVAVEDDRVVSTMGKYPMTAWFGICEIPAPVYEILIADHDGVPHACGRIYMDDDAPYVMDLAGRIGQGSRRSGPG